MLIPALDLSEGQVVRLKQGDFNQKTVFEVDPVTYIVEAAHDGADFMHLVDLDGAKDPALRQHDLINRIVKKSPVPIETGGGIRTYEDVLGLLNDGVARVVIGSVAVKEPETVKKWLRKFGASAFTLALDVRVVDDIPYVATSGWLETSSLAIDDVLKEFLPYGIAHILVTDISRDGMMQGANNSLYAKIHKSYPDLDIIASGGISSLSDLAFVKKAGATSVVVGRALLEGKFTVKEALACWQNA